MVRKEIDQPKTNLEVSEKWETIFLEFSYYWYVEFYKGPRKDPAQSYAGFFEKSLI